jgi:hypothetical protein
LIGDHQQAILFGKYEVYGSYLHPLRRRAADTDVLLPLVDFLASNRLHGCPIPRKDRKVLLGDTADIDLAAYSQLAAKGFPPLVYMFCRETEDPASLIRLRVQKGEGGCEAHVGGHVTTTARGDLA